LIEIDVFPVLGRNSAQFEQSSMIENIRAKSAKDEEEDIVPINANSLERGGILDCFESLYDI
jgi:hypothetical protein